MKKSNRTPGKWRTQSKPGKVVVTFPNGKTTRFTPACFTDEGSSVRLTREQIDYKAYLASPEWQKIRQQVLARDWSRCRRCGSRDELQVHHTTYERIGRELLTDLVTLCDNCHGAHHDGSHLWVPPERPKPEPRLKKQKRKKINPYSKAKRKQLAQNAAERKARSERMWREAQRGEVKS